MTKNNATEYIVIGDSHIGSVSDSYLESNGLERSVNEAFKQFDTVIDYAEERAKHNRVVILHTGDVFDDNHPSMAYIRMFIERLNRIEELGILTFLLVGNHDANNSGDSALSPILKIKYRNIKVINEMVSAIDGKDINFIFIPHLVKSQFKIKDKDDFKSFVEKYIKEKTSELINPEKKNIIVGHLQYQNAVTGSEERMLKGGINIFPDVDKKNISMILLGHIHKRQMLKYGKIPIYYTGSMKVEDFGERDDDKGFLVVNNELETQFHDLNTQKFKQIEIDLIKKETVNLDPEKIEKAVKGKIVKLIINMAEKNKNRININEIYEAFSKYCFVSKIERNIVRSEKEKVKTESYSPKQILKKYIAANVPEKEQSEILKYGIEILDKVVGQ